MNCIVVDIGNTRASVGLLRGGRVIRTVQVLKAVADPAVIDRRIRSLIAGTPIDGSVLCSVVPRLNRLWTGCLARAAGAKPIVVSHKIDLGVGIDYPKPATIGADRLANASGAVARYAPPVIVADFGTALTFDIVSAEGRYVGGVIAPGMPLMLDYLAERTALLPRIRIPGPCASVGRSTAGAMRIGARIGYRGMVREITEYLLDGLGTRDVRLAATGGYAPWALDGLDMGYVLDADLTLYGLGRIFELNCGARD